jgi:hypothetical protein
VPFPLLTVVTIALIVTGASSTSYAYRDQIVQIIEITGTGHNSSEIQDGVAVSTSEEITEGHVVSDDNVIDTTPVTLPVHIAVSEDSAIDDRGGKSKRESGSAAVRGGRDAGSDESSQSISKPGSELEDSSIAVDYVSSQEASGSSSSTSVTYSSGGGGGGGGGSSRSREDRAANEKSSDESNGKKNSNSTGNSNNDVPSGTTNSTGTGDQTNSTQGIQDTVKPKIAITSPGKGEVISGMLNVTGKASDAGGNVTKVEVRINQSPYKKAIPLNPTWSDWYAIVEINNGPAKIEARARDASGNIQKFSVSVVGVPQQDSGSGTEDPIADTEPPTISGPPNLEGEATGLLTKLSSLGFPTVSDNSGNISSVTNDAPPLGFSLGTTMVEWVATDSSGNSAVAYQNVTIRDTTAPSLAPPPDMTVESNSTPAQVTLLPPKVTDNYDTSPALTSDAPAKGFPLGTTVVTWTASDSSGNKATANHYVTVVKPAEVTLPIIAASPQGSIYAKPVSVQLTSSVQTAAIFYTVDGSTPGTSSPRYSLPISISSTTTLKYFARDAAGNQGPVQTQKYVIDLIAPTVAASPVGGTFSASKSVRLSASEPGATIFFTTDGTTPTEASRKYSEPVSISTTTTLRYFAKDPAGNSGTASNQKYIIDKTAPAVTASPLGGLYGNALSVSLKSNEAGTIYYTTDGSTPTIASPKYSKPLSIPTTSVLKYFAKDSAGNTGAVASQTYTIDTIAPKITPPADIMSEATGPLTRLETLGTPTASDNVGPITVSNNASSLSFVVGTTKVVWTVKDAVGRTSTALQLIDVKDTRAPSLVAPADKSAQILDGSSLIAVPLGEPTVSDLADPSPNIFNNAPSHGFPVGTTYVTWTARDDSGNQATATQKVSVSAMPQPEEKKLIIRIMTINNDEATRAVIRNHLGEDDFINNFRLPVLGMYPGQNQALNEQSIDDVRAAIATEIPASKVDVDFIEYDNEAGNGDLSTPESELVDPAAATNQAMKIIHDAGYKSGVAPTRRILMQELGGVQWANVDYVVMQLQKVVGTQEFRDIADKVSTTTRKQNPDIVIFAQINPALNSVEEIVDAVNSVRDDIDGVGIVWTMSDTAQLDKLLTALGR